MMPNSHDLPQPGAPHSAPEQDVQNQARATRHAQGGETSRAADSLPTQENAFAVLPRQLGRYRVEKLLGSGAMGAVYLATDTQLERPVALKIPKISSTGSEMLLKRMETEAKVLAKLDHPQICKVYDFAVIDQIRFIAMEYIEGEDLKSLFKRLGRKQKPAIAIQIITHLARGLAVAHEKGIIHRDLKPENVMRRSNGRLVIMDFGLARQSHIDPGAERTQGGLVLGSAAYMSPEQANGQLDEIDQRSDIYALGVMFFEMLSGQWPFLGNALQIMGQKATQVPPSILKVAPDLSPDLDVVCQKLLSKEKKDRYRNCGDVIKALKAVDLEGGTVVTTDDVIVSSTTQASGISAPLHATNPHIFDFTHLENHSSIAASPSLPETETLSTGIGGSWSQFPPVVKVAVFAVPLALMILAGILFLQTRHGTLRIDIADPTLAVKIDDETVSFENSGKPIRISATKSHTLQIQQNGITLDAATREITLNQGEQRVMTVTLLDGNVAVDGKILGDGELNSVAEDFSPITLNSSPETIPSPLSIRSDQPDTSSFEHLQGQWKVKFRSGFVHTYDISSEGIVKHNGPVKQSNLYRKDRDVLLKFDVDKIERFSIHNGKLFVEHWSPAAGYSSGRPCGDVGESIQPAPTLSTTANSGELEAAKYVLSVGGTVSIRGTDQQVNELKDLPAGSFSLSGIIFPQTAKPIVPAEFAILKNCRLVGHLQFFGMTVPNAALVHLKDWTALQVLEFNDCRLEPNALSHFKNCRNVRFASFWATPFTDADLARLNDWPLTSLNLGRTNVTSEAITRLSNQSSLTRVLLSQTRIDDAGVAALSDCHSLQELALDATDITNKCAATLKKLKSLTSLHLYKTLLTPDVIKELQVALPNCKIESVLSRQTDPKNDVSIQQLKNMLVDYEWSYLDSLHPPGDKIRFYANGKFHDRWKWNYWVVGPKTMHVQFWDADYAPQKSVDFTFNEELSAFSATFSEGSKTHVITGFRLQPVAAAVEPVKKEITHPEITGAEVFGKHSYKVFTDVLRWNEAQERCEQLGGHLAYVETMAENQFITELVKRSGVQDAWLGATDETVEGHWRWLDGRTLRFTNWEPSQPNNKLLSEHYLLVRTFTNGKWCDQPNSSTQHQPGFVCEWNEVFPSTKEPAPTSNKTTSAQTELKFVPLFNGKDLTGWRTHPRQPGGWRVVDDVLVGRGSDSFETSHLFTTRDDFGDFHLRVEARLNNEGNSGIYFHAPFAMIRPETNPKFPDGCEVQIYNNPGTHSRTGALFMHSTSATVLQPAPVANPGEWFEMEIISIKDRVQVLVKGKPVSEYSNRTGHPLSGCLALQLLGKETVVEFRKIEIATEGMTEAVSATQQEKSSAPEPAPASIPTSESSGRSIPKSVKKAVLSVANREKVRVKFTTTKGDILVEVHPEWSPRGASQFLNAVDEGVYHDAAFFRAIKGFVVQFGIAGDPKLDFKWQKKFIPDEPRMTSNERGTLSFATSGPNTRRCQVFVNVAENIKLDEQGFVPFAMIVEGLNVIDAINTEYGETPDQTRIHREGNAYLKSTFPDLDYVVSAEILYPE